MSRLPMLPGRAPAAAGRAASEFWSYGFAHRRTAYGSD
jgi:hypothetical protein